MLSLRASTYLHSTLILLILGSLFLLLIKSGLWLLISGSVAMLDFDTYYQTAVDVRQGSHPYAVPYMQTLGPPSVLIPFLPLSLLPLASARVFMLVSSILAGWWCCWLLTQALDCPPQYRLLASLGLSVGLFSAFPTRFTLALGQPNLLITAGLTHAWFSSNKWKGWGLVLSAIFKTPFIFVSGAFITRPAILWQVFWGTLVIIIMTLPWIKPQFYHFFLRERVIANTLTSSSANNVDYYNQSLRATLFRLNQPNSYHLVLGLLMPLLAWFTIKSQSPAIGITATLLISPVVWQHYVVVLFPVLCYSAWCLIRYRLYGWIPLWLMSFTGWWVELPWLHLAPMRFPYSILASHFYISAVLGLVLLIRLGKNTSLPSLFTVRPK